MMKPVVHYRGMDERRGSQGATWEYYDVTLPDGSTHEIVKYWRPWMKADCQTLYEVSWGSFIRFNHLTLEQAVKRLELLAAAMADDIDA